eukprot:9492542-Pyramimonas_sp.AAC.1
MAGPSPKDMGQQLALQLLAAFGNSPNPDSDAAEALAHAQLWLCNMRKTVRKFSEKFQSTACCEKVTCSQTPRAPPHHAACNLDVRELVALLTLSWATAGLDNFCWRWLGRSWNGFRDDRYGDAGEWCTVQPPLHNPLRSDV